MGIKKKLTAFSSTLDSTKIPELAANDLIFIYNQSFVCTNISFTFKNASLEDTQACLPQ